MIAKLQNYYGKAIRENLDSIDSMRKAIWATYYHISSTPENPCHQFCPATEDSWCYWYNKKKTISSTPLPKSVMVAMKSIYEDLSKPDLLNRCTAGGTQNANESFNSCIWNILPKSVFIRLKVFQLGIYLASLVFNDGQTSLLSLLSNLGIEPGFYCNAALSQIDNSRVLSAEKRLNLPKRRSSEEAVDEFNYAPGGFD